MYKLNILILLIINVFILVNGKWWQNGTIYQIYVRSYKDLYNADGIGDLLGVKSQIKVFKDMGINSICLSPIYKSPMIDFGYDITNYKEIDPQYGTMIHFEDLVKDLHDNGIKLILDFVPNHSSSEHEWFIKSINESEEYSNYYVWKDPNGYNNENEPIEPNNWLSVYGGSAWTWNEKRQQFYLHHFTSEQPDLNYYNTQVLQEMTEIMTFWLEKGVDGFRIDSVSILMEDENYLNEPISNNTLMENNQYGYLKHIYTRDIQGSYHIVYQLRKHLDSMQAALQKDLLMIIEAYSNFENTLKYCKNGNNSGGHFAFNFQFIFNITNSSKAIDIEETIDLWYEKIVDDYWPNWVLGNHDQHRVATRIGRDFSSALLIMSTLLPGTAITYYGEEINMENTFILWENTKDPQGYLAGIDYYEKYTRDPERTPYQWNSGPNAGFSPADSIKPWLPINENYQYLNFDHQYNSNHSYYYMYKKLILARKLYPCITIGTFKHTVYGTDIFSFIRELPGPNHSILVLINTGNEHEMIINSKELYSTIPDVIEFYTGSLNCVYNKTMQLVNSTQIHVPARGGAVFLYESKSSSSSIIIKSSIILLLFSFFYIYIIIL